jgi:outer membrane immunogenic protein
MKKLFAACAVAAVFWNASAMSADMATKPVYAKSPVMAPAVVVDSWTGFYVGAALGWKEERSNWTTTSLQNVPPFVTTVDATSPRGFNPSTGRFGGYFGYDWQISPQWVAGVEADAAFADRTVTAAGIPGCAASCFPGSLGPGADLSSVRMNWDASLRARLGFLVMPNVLLYGTGGVAWQNISTSATCQHALNDPFCFVVAGNPLFTATNSTTRTGWTVGGGVDVKVASNWYVRGEYRYADFGTWNDALNLSLGAATPNVVNYQLKTTTQIATFGITYKFGGPVVAAY